MGGPLVCPSCRAEHGGDERFCRDCGMPLVHASGEAGAPKDGTLRDRARKVRPQYADGPLVRVARARHQAEAEMIEAMLLEEGIPALARRSGGFDVPDFLASGPRDILVPASGAAAARDVLGATDPEAPGGDTAAAPGVAATARATGAGTPAWVRALAVVLAVLVLVVIAAGVLTAILP